jgi:hypothetical protein
MNLINKLKFFLNAILLIAIIFAGISIIFIIKAGSLQKDVLTVNNYAIINGSGDRAFLLGAGQLSVGTNDYLPGYAANINGSVKAEKVCISDKCFVSRSEFKGPKGVDFTATGGGGKGNDGANASVTYGGAYQVRSFLHLPNFCLSRNSFTGTCSCPTTHTFSKQIIDDTAGGTWYVCYK